jgi:DNA-directed RNA polymerase specialized sigma24 family protein
VTSAHHLPVDVLDADWRREASAPLMRARFAAWRDAEPALSRFGDVVSLLRFMRRPGSGAGKDGVLRALLARARHERLAARVVLQLITPGLKRLAGEILTDARDRDELWSALLAVAWEQIRTYPVERRPRRVAANLLLDTLHRTLAELARQTRRSIAEVAQSVEGAGWPCADERDVDALLERAVAAAAITPREAEVILVTRIDGIRLSDVARQQGVSYNTMKLRRQRAERRLLAFLGYVPVPRGQQRRPSSGARVARRASPAPSRVNQRTSGR